MSFSVFVDVLIAIYVVARQRHVRPVPRALHLRIPIVVGGIGLLEMMDEVTTRHPSGADVLWVLATLAVGAAGLGALRAVTVKLWAARGWVMRQGSGLTIALWVISLGLHFTVRSSSSGAGQLEASSFLLYLGLTYGVQSAVLYRRASVLWDALGPDAGRGIRVTFAPGAFFATFGRGGAGAPPPSHPSRDDPTIIDAEVLDEDP